jgi:hypothetical protein
MPGLDTLHTGRCFLPSLAPFGQAVSEEKIFLTLANQKKEFILVASETAGQNGAKLGRKHLCKILYKASSIWFHSANKHGHQDKFFFLIG